MSNSSVHYEERDGVAIITYDRQERRNAWDVAMYREVVEAIQRANASDAVGAIVITHAGPVFCAGADFKGAPPPPDPVTGRSPNIAEVSMQQDSSWLHLLSESKPSIGAFHGACVGLGATQILPFDIRIGGESSTYAFPFLALGYMPELGCTALLPQIVGYARAVDICLSSAKLDAREAHRIGLITRLTADDQVLNEAIKLAMAIAKYPRLQTALTRRLFRENATERNLNTLLGREFEAFVTMFKAIKKGDKDAQKNG
ncbi:MAG: enoyl-CoA hydratase-related protein [Spongiibacteraceae bacterium]